MNMRLYLPSVATVIVFFAFLLSVLFLWEAMDDSAEFQAEEPISITASVVDASPIILSESVEAVDIYPLINRPLFASSRRVPEIIAPLALEPEMLTTPATDTTPQPETLPPPALVMIGILLDGPTPRALILDANGLEEWVEVKDSIEGWLVVRISTQSITLQLNGESVDIYTID